MLNKFNQQIDKCMNSENGKLQSEMEAHVSSLWTDLCDDIAEINAILNSMSDNFQTIKIPEYVKEYNYPKFTIRIRVAMLLDC